MSFLDDENVRAAVHATIARQILESIGTEHRDAILRLSIERALKEWHVASEINKVVAMRAAEVVAELCRTREWTERITAMIQVGLEDYLRNLREAIPGVIVQALHGKQGKDTYSNEPALILKCWPKSPAT